LKKSQVSEPTKNTVAVIVPTWRRPKDLERCLLALYRQTVLPTRVIVAYKEDDDLTIETFHSLQASKPPSVAVSCVSVPPQGNVVTQQTAALGLTSEAIVAITDDDAEPRSDWIERLLGCFEDPAIGGVGGRDWQPIERWDEPTVGKLLWYGKTIGNHHLGVGPARDVEILKGVNCAFRGDLRREIGFDPKMRGRGTVINWELALSFAMLRKGYRLVYDPAICVDHHISVRQDGDVNQRGGFEPASLFDNVHNEVLSIFGHLSPVKKIVYLAWSELVGTRGNPGLVQVIRLMAIRADRPVIVLRKYLVSLRARWRALVTWGIG
jgi:cellulose synthase/poly-beta-1,6-N-acetylglucosamine synthase-like glycosyltransferase